MNRMPVFVIQILRKRCRLFICNAAHDGIIVAGLEVVQLGFLVVNISAVTQRVIGAQCRGQAASCRQQSAPGIVGVAYNLNTNAVNNGNLPARKSCVFCYNNRQLARYIASWGKFFQKGKTGACKQAPVDRFIYSASSIKPKPPSFLRYTTANLPS